MQEADDYPVTDLSPEENHTLKTFRWMNTINNILCKNLSKHDQSNSWIAAVSVTFFFLSQQSVPWCARGEMPCARLPRGRKVAKCCPSSCSTPASPQPLSCPSLLKCAIAAEQWSREGMVTEWLRRGQIEVCRGATWISEISQAKEKSATQMQLYSLGDVGARF